MNQKIFVIDNFIEGPLAYHDKIAKSFDPEIKADIEKKYPESNVFQDISSILRSNIQVLESKDYVQKERDRSPICCHMESDYIGVLYLTLPLSAWGEVGIKFYSHKETGLDSFPTQEQARNITDIDKTFSQNLENWKEYGSIPIKHNRLILFRSNLWHSYGNGFGSDLNTSMLYKKIIIKNG
jgi:predicted nucleic acid-binding protein